MKLTIISNGLSLLELRGKYKTGANGFYDSLWYLDEAFAKEKPPTGTFEINVSNDLNNLTFDEQVKKLDTGWEVAHPAHIAQALLEYRENTGKYLAENYYLRTSSLDSARLRVLVGYFASGGLYVVNRYRWDDRAYDGVGLASSWKSIKSFEPGNLESLASLDPFGGKLSLEHRQVLALERIADALEGKPKKKKHA